MQQTVQQFLETSIQEMAGIRADSCAALALLNRARELLYPLDDWEGTVEFGIVQNADCHFYLPWHIETVRAIWQGNRSAKIETEYWNRIDCNDVSYFCGPKTAYYRTGSSRVLPISYPIGHKLGFRLTDAEDKDVKLKVTIQNPTGSVVTEEIQLTEIVEPTFIETVIGDIRAIQKPSTFGGIEVWQIAACGACKFIYRIEAKEQNPLYYQYKGGCSTCPSFIIKGKKKFFPYESKDLGLYLDITSPEGLRFAIQAVEHQRNKKYNEYQAALQIARTHLERVKEDTRNRVAASIPGKFHPQFQVSSLSYGNW